MVCLQNPFIQGNKNIFCAGEPDIHALHRQHGLKIFCSLEHDVLFLCAIIPCGSRIFAAVARIYHYPRFTPVGRFYLLREDWKGT